MPRKPPKAATTIRHRTGAGKFKPPPADQPPATVQQQIRDSQAIRSTADPSGTDGLAPRSRMPADLWADDPEQGGLD